MGSVKKLAEEAKIGPKEYKTRTGVTLTVIDGNNEYVFESDIAALKHRSKFQILKLSDSGNETLVYNVSNEFIRIESNKKEEVG